MEFSELCVRTWHVLLFLLPFVLWCAFWLWAVNWKTAWKVLGQGGWLPLVLLAVMATAAWSRIDSRNYSFMNLVPLASFWWQAVVVSGLLGLALFCGWLQGYLHYTPVTVELEPPPAAHGHEHGQH